MSAVSVVKGNAVVKDGVVHIDGTARKFVEYEVEIPTGGGPVCIWLDTERQPGSNVLLVFCAPRHHPVLFSANAAAVQMLIHMSRHTVATWCRRAANIDL